MTKRLCGLASLFFVLGFGSIASAHYLWVSVTTDSAGKSVANVYFEEGPAAGTGEYLDPIIKSGKTWIRTVENPKPELITTADTTEAKKRWLWAEISQAAPRSLDSYGKFGVYRYGNTDVLLHYYARHLDLTSHEDLHELARAEMLRLEIVPHDEADGIELKVLWDGKPAAGKTIYARGPKGFQKNLKTDEKGEVTLETKEPGRYLFRTFVEEKTPGSDGGKEYSLIRHHGSLVMTLPLKD